MSSSSVEGAVNVYADGSTLWNDARKGGVGIRLVVINDAGDDEEVDVPIIGFKATTPNQMELHACAVGIREAMAHPAYARLQRIVVHSDSRYVTENRADAVFYWPSTMSLKFRTVLGILFLGGEQYGKEEAISGFPAFERSKAAAGAGS